MGGRLNWPAAGKLGTQSLRRGAARALTSAGATLAQLLRAGQWRWNAVRFYFDLSAGGRRATAEILIEGSEDEPL